MVDISTVAKKKTHTEYESIEHQRGEDMRTKWKEKKKKKNDKIVPVT